MSTAGVRFSDTQQAASSLHDEPIYWDASDEEDDDDLLPSVLQEERHNRWIKPPRQKDIRRFVSIFLLGCGLFSVAVIIVVAVVAVVESKRLKGLEEPVQPTSGFCQPSIKKSPFVVPPDATSPTSRLEWWKTAVIYQCYPRSYQDCDGDGSGDLKGIISRVGYLSDIGVNALWLNPIFRSPQRDNGYDISNYTDVNPLFGTMEELKVLIHELHNRSMHLLLDFVPNHTSDEHPWFLESRRDKTNSKRNWYVWADGREGGRPPNNWISVFKGSAWTYDNLTDQYYLHQFSSFQPDLNYSNPEVVGAFEDVLRFWLDLGVDGFRIDAVVHLLEDPLFRDEPINPSHGPDCQDECYDYLIHNYTRSWQGIHGIVRGWRRVLDSYSTTGQRFMVGEVYDPIDVVMSYYGSNEGDEFHFPFNFFLLTSNEWTGSRVYELVQLWLDNMPEGRWPNWVLGNHDNHRIASKAGHYLARALNVLLLTLPGTPTTYYGEEIMMLDVEVRPELKQDVYGDRDMERTPMQWNNLAYAGFTSASSSPWLPVGLNYSVVNVQSEQDDSVSMLSLYTQLTKMRSTYPAFQSANYLPVITTSESFGFVRNSSSDPSQFLVVLNFAENAVTVGVNASFSLPSQAQVFLSSYVNRTGILDLGNFTLLGGEALIFKWNN